ncbi:MAG: hypothetical protein ABSA09_04480 [Desulfobaccales bacterium]
MKFKAAGVFQAVAAAGSPDASRWLLSGPANPPLRSYHKNF